MKSGQSDRAHVKRAVDRAYEYRKQLEREKQWAPKHPTPWVWSIEKWAHQFLNLELPKHQSALVADLFDSPLSTPFVDLEPRGHGKSTICSYLLPLFVICESTCTHLNQWLTDWLVAPNDLRILHISASRDLDKKYLRAIKRELEYNPRIIKYYGKLKGDPWATLTFSIKDRVTRKEETMAGAGILTDIIGWHGDLVIVDDCIQDDRPKDLKVREKKKIWADEVLEGSIDPNTRVWWIGTRKSKFDIYQHIMDKPDTIARVRKAIIDENKKLVLWPTKCSYEWLAKKRKKIGSFIFSREFQNEARSEEGSLLKKDWIKMYKVLPFARQNGYCYMGVDPAIGITDTADFTVIATLYVWDNQFYLDDLQRGHWSFLKTKNMISYTFNDFAPLQIGVEANFYQRALSQDLIDTSLLPITEVKHLRDKETRIMSTLGLYAEQGKFYINKNIPFKEELETEWLDFPEGEHDDILDAIATTLELAVHPMGAVLFA